MPRRKREEKDGKPKRGLTAYMLFSQSKRPEIKAKNPNATFGELGKLLGEAWKAIDEEDKKPFTEAAAKDKIRYQKDLAQFKIDHPEDSDDEKKKKKGKGKGKNKKQPAKKRKTAPKDPDAPKKTSSAFFCFSKEQRPIVKEKNPSATFGELGKLLGAAWQNLGPDEKKKYELLSAEDKKRYERESKAYEEKKKKEAKEESESSSSDSGSGSGSDSDSSSDSDSD